jgi:hypothetical protein
MRQPALALLATALLVVGAHSADARLRGEPVFAESARDPALTKRIMSLGPNVDPAEARLVAQVAFNTGRELAREWRVVWPPGFHNFLVHQGKRPAGLCFQWAAALLARLDTLKLKTLELHWAESFNGTMSEHNVIVVTAKGQPFAQGVLLDNWRYGGRLAWGIVSLDPHYRWTENKPELTRRLSRKANARESS